MQAVDWSLRVCGRRAHREVHRDRVLLLLINVAAVGWLVSTKRLFGVRGGFAAYRRLHNEQSLLTVERSALLVSREERTDSTVTDRRQNGS